MLDEFEAQLAAGGDTKYFRYHQTRFGLTMQALREVLPPKSRVLDVGSHYLHLSAMMAHEGHDVTGLDVAEFHQLDFVARRAQALGIHAETVDDLGRGQFLASHPNDTFDAVVFCEIMEHITFNPVSFWRRIYDLLKPGGVVFISTPNSLRLTNVLKTAYRLLARRGVGIPVDEILETVTYGHHWKEYSAGELRQYFGRLSPDFNTSIRFVDYDLAGALGSAVVRRAGVIVPSFRPHLEAVIRLPQKTQWLAQSPAYED